MSDIAVWLENLGLGKYRAVFAENEIDFALLPKLTEQHLKELDLPLGPRLKLLDAIAALAPEKNEANSANDAVKPAEQPASAQAERRQLTVMFVDLVGSTALSEKLDPEDLREVIQDYQHTVRDETAWFDGYVAKYMGDGILVYFGYPKARENSAESAIRAGLAIVGAVARLRPRNIPLQTRIGIATGLVVVGEIIGKGLAQEQAVVGETPNLAARLQSLAQADTVLVSEHTRRLVGGVFEYTDLGRHRFKGFSQPLPAWQVVRETTLLSRFEATHASQTLTPLIGREEELEILLRRWQQTRFGEGQVVLLSGEAGIGKSRLLQAMRENLRDESHAQLRYFCVPYYQASALYPVINQLERAAGFSREDNVSQKLDKLERLLAQSGEKSNDSAPLLAALLSLTEDDRYPPLKLEPQRQKQQTLEALLKQLTDLARRQPVLVLFEDLHWIDPTSLELLALLVERLVDLPILLLLSSRPGFSAVWSDQAHVTVLNLNRLNGQRAAQIVEKVSGGKPMPEAVLEEILAKTDGVPLFVEELTKTVMESGLLRDTNERYELNESLPAITVPSTLQDSLMERLDRLPPQVKDIAQIGAVIGREFGYRLLSAVTGLDDQTLQAALVQLTEAEQVFQRGTPPEARYSFKHALVQDTAYASLLKSKRQHLHALAAQVLETQFSKIATTKPELLAHHYTSADLHAQAINYWYQAGAQANQRSAYTEAISNLNKGLHLLDELPASRERTQQALNLQMTRAGVLAISRGYLEPESVAAYLHARELCQQLGNPPAGFPILRGICNIYLSQGKMVAAFDVAQECLKLAENQQDPAALSLAQRLVGMMFWWRGQPVAAHKHIERALALYDPEQHATSTLTYGMDLKSGALNYLSQALLLLGYPDQALATVQEGLILARQLGYTFNIFAAMNFLDLTHMARGEYQLVGGAPMRSLELTRELRTPSWATLTVQERDQAMYRLGEIDSDTMITRLRGLLSDCQSIGHMVYRPTLLGRLAEVLAAAGQIDEALDVIAEGLATIEQTEECWNEAELYRLQGRIMLTRSGPDAASGAEVCFRQALAIAREQQAKWWELRSATSLAQLWQQQNKYREAYELLSPVYNWFTEGFDTADLKDAKALLEELS